MNQQATQQRLVRMPEVLRITGLSKSSVYDRMNRGLFPKSVSLGGRSIAFVESEVNQWVNSQISQRDKVA
ncbi:helix-turn-helix transcriptional regulator [Vibrio neonatus]|uniref:helix-turn-helix transcriptional regulator n=1 Tax=Vibrio neonatus TaxID=278860 RepID=UPI0021C3036A|nr:AlpA family transcriptional regulator [Vibrio neonatus]